MKILIFMALALIIGGCASNVAEQVSRDTYFEVVANQDSTYVFNGSTYTEKQLEDTLPLAVQQSGKKKVLVISKFDLNVGTLLAIAIPLEDVGVTLHFLDSDGKIKKFHFIESAHNKAFEYAPFHSVGSADARLSALR